MFFTKTPNLIGTNKASLKMINYRCLLKIGLKVLCLLLFSKLTERGGGKRGSYTIQVDNGLEYVAVKLNCPTPGNALLYSVREKMNAASCPSK